MAGDPAELNLEELEESAGSGSSSSASTSSSSSGARKRGPGRPPGSKNKSSSSSSSRKLETEIESRVERAMHKLADSREGRDDEELAAVLREDSTVIASSVAGLTRPFPPARQIVILALTVLEPVLAFGRIGRILMTRFAERRWRRAAEQAAAENGVPGGVVAEGDYPPGYIPEAEVPAPPGY